MDRRGGPFGRPGALAALLWAAPVLLLVAGRLGTGGSPAAPARPALPPAAGRASDSDAAALQNLPYILHARDSRSDLRGVLVDRKDRASPGVNFFFPWSLKRSGRAYLIDEAGNVLWRWSLRPFLEREAGNPWVGHFELLPDGALIAVLENRSIVKLDRDSRVLWETRLRAHHDAWVDPGGDLYVCARFDRLVPEIHPALPIHSDAVVVLSPDGVVKRTIFVVDLLRRSGYSWLLPRLQGAEIPPSVRALDVFHLNHVEVFDGSLARLSPMFARGNLLISIRNLNVIAIVDRRSEKIVWLWGPGNLTYQHDPRLLPDGRILVFDNGTERSQVLEIDPLRLQVTWRYAPPSGFFSRIVGAAQRLPNGNTLITESMKGYAFEVAPSGETVWQYANPEFGKRGMRNGILRMTRYDPAKLTFLAER